MGVFGRQSVQQHGGVAQALTANLGAGLHPHVSIRGGQFALVDATGERWGAPFIVQQTQQGQKILMLAIIAGSNPNRSRIYYREAYDQNNPGPPDCFSDNGLAPSDQASDPQARTCGECVFSKWGSDRSPLTGKKTKSCDEKKKVALLVVGDTTGLVYELQIPPASLKNIAKYASEVSGYTPPGETRRADPSDFITAISFVEGQTGILEFAPYTWISAAYRDTAEGVIKIAYNDRQEPVNAPDGGESVAALIDDVWASKELDELLGLNDRPWTPPALAGPLPGMVGYVPPPTATMEPQAHGGALQRGSTSAPIGYDPRSPYSPPQGFVNPNPAPLPAGGAPASPAGARPAGRSAMSPAPAGRGGGRTAPPTQLPPQGQVIPPAQQRAEGPGEEAIPAFLARSRAASGPTGGVAAAPGPASPTFTPGEAPRPSEAMTGAVEKAMTLALQRGA